MTVGLMLTDRKTDVPAYEARMQPQARARQAKPITAHHMFVPLVSLWFGALFSLSSLAVRTGLLEQIIVTIGVDRLFPYASPPLGHTARLLIAAVFGLCGAAIGAMLGRAVAAGDRGEREGDPFVGDSRGSSREASADVGGDYRVRARDAHPDAPARRPISASTELGEMEASGEPEEMWLTKRVPAAPEGAAGAEQDSPPLPAWFSPAEAAGPVVAATSDDGSGPEVETPATEVLPPLAQAEMTGTSSEVVDPDYPEAWRNTAERIAHAPPEVLGHVELIERLAIAINNHDEGEADGKHGAEVMKPGAGLDAAATIKALREALAALRGS